MAADLDTKAVPIVDKYIRDARTLIATQEHSEIASALSLLDAALALSPRLELALELKARSLLYLRRFKDVADMLQDYIPSLKMANDDSGSVSSDSSSQQLSRERVKLLHSGGDSSDDSLGRDPSFKCFSVSDLKKKVMAGLCRNCEKEGQWRYLVLGQACCHLGLMEDAMVLLQTGKRLATAAFRRESISLSDDSFPFSKFPVSNNHQTPPATPPRTMTESESVSQLLSHIKLLLRRRTAAIAALDAGLYSEAIRHFSKIVDGRRGAPQGFLAECYMHRAFAYRSSGRIAESIADCNKTLALEPSCIQALDTRALLLETIRCLPDCLHDLEHLKLLYNAILRDRKLPGPAWKRHNVRYREIPGKLCALTTKIQELKQRVASGETGNVDYYALIGLRRGCSRSELERAHLLLSLRHKPDKAISFTERCEFADERDLDSVRDRAKMSALLLYRLLQRGYSSVMSNIMDEEAAEKRRKTATAVTALQAATQVQQQAQNSLLEQEVKLETTAAASSLETTGAKIINSNDLNKGPSSSNANVYQGIFCRDIAAVGNLLSQAGFNRPLTVKYEALSC
ncbi:TPR REGION domain-containing protein [Citrus sinensis]|uniref:TPR REGION domain-containing protein n=1 Tax=Citrus sinensis TaxID=2711 RepID=A0ACB8ML97_CITSI|nr:TPR REGION domain-containing protein [Citrus sinensis]